MVISNADPLKDCPKCGENNVPFGRNKTTKDGLSYWCKRCMNRSRRGSVITKPNNWKEINGKRRSKPEFRKQRKKEDVKDAIRRQTEPGYTQKRSASNKKYRSRPEIRDHINQQRRERYQLKKEAAAAERARKLEKTMKLLEWSKLKGEKGWTA